MRLLYSIWILVGTACVFTRLPESLLAPQVNNVPHQLPTSPTQPITNSNWVATDGIGRSLPTFKEVGPVRKDKYVGIFYFTWHGEPNTNKTIYDITKILQKSTSNPSFGPRQAFHWWGEPEAGYFKADDPWVIHRNLQMLAVAGVDVLFLDATNGTTYLDTVKKLCAISQGMRRQGQKTPYLCFITHTNTAATVADLYKFFYKTNQYADLWFRWNGKPLILGQENEVTDTEQRSFFTWRFSWQFTEAKTQPGHWQWMDTTPQDYGWIDTPDKPEQISVAVASHPIFNIGKSYANSLPQATNKYYISRTTDEGLYFAEQWKYARAVNPKIVFVTGWNEWIAQRFIADSNDRNMAFKDFLGHRMKQGESFFMDLYNKEFNRDIEPMKGGYSDNYYYQLVANIRRFKGMASVEPTKNSPVNIDGKFSDWTSVKPSFYDPQGDVVHRNWPRFDDKVRLTNKTGRNDIIESRVAYDKEYVYFYARTAKSITKSNEKNWMLLFVDLDRSKKTGWEGYDLVINRQVYANGMSLIYQWKKGQWLETGKAVYKIEQDKLELSVPRKLFNSVSTLNFDFHWADNIQRWNDITTFFLNGDSAPDRRFNYRYTSQ